MALEGVDDGAGLDPRLGEHDALALGPVEELDYERPLAHVARGAAAARAAAEGRVGHGDAARPEDLVAAQLVARRADAGRAVQDGGPLHSPNCRNTARP